MTAINISAGTEWEYEINTHLNAAQIVLMLVSPDFMASDYCYGIEMVQAMKRHDSGEVCVIPIILRPVRWQEASFSTLQVLPSDAVPVVSLKDQRAHNLSFVTFIPQFAVAFFAIFLVERINEREFLDNAP
jgi:hypothetical protein